VETKREWQLSFGREVQRSSLVTVVLVCEPIVLKDVVVFAVWQVPSAVHFWPAWVKPARIGSAELPLPFPPPVKLAETSLAPPYSSDSVSSLWISPRV
jgi:hypothetical protein